MNKQEDHWDKVVSLIRLANEDREVQAQLQSGNPFEIVKALERVELDMEEVGLIREELENIGELGVIW